MLDSAKEITDSSSVSCTTTARGTTTTTVYEGRDALFEAEDYSWYLLSETPSHYKSLTAADGSFSFGPVTGASSTVTGVTGDITYNARHADIEIKLSGTEGIASGDAVSGVVITTAGGAKYALPHVSNLWRGTEIGWDGDELMCTGRGAVAITNIRYITQSAVIDYPVAISIAARGESGFTDLPGNTWYTEAAAWAVEKGYLSNRGDGHFKAASNPSRAEIATYLWSAAGKPEPTLTENPFSDVKEDASYYKAVLWAAENGITDGVGGGLYYPDGTLDRCQLVTFLWKQAGRPASSANNPFADVAENAWYRDAVLWAVENGITVGTSAKTFSPDLKVNLAQLVTFLYRNDSAWGSTFLAKLRGSYVELFPEMTLDRYRSVWRDALLRSCSADEEEIYYQMLTQSCMREPYGPAAIEAYTAAPETAGYNCFFLHGISGFTIDGSTIYGTDAGGGEVFRHNYSYIGDIPALYFGQQVSTMHVYKSDDPDSGNFAYFAFSDDTPEDTYHLEFRYGASEADLGNFTEGAYAYWLAAAIPAGYSDQLMTDCITLFVEENMGEE